MAVDSASFLVRFPEFSNQETAVITSTIEEAQRLNDEDLWGDQYDDAVNYFTAHLLSGRTQAIGSQIGIANSPRTTKYVGAAGYTLADTQYGATYLFLREGLVELTGFSY